MPRGPQKKDEQSKDEKKPATQQRQSDPSNKKDEKDPARADDGKQVANPSLAQPKADKALKEVREVHAEHYERNRYEGRTDTDEVVSGVQEDEGKDPDQVKLRTAGGRLFVSVSAKEVELDHDGVADLQRKVQQAFQAVS